MQHLTKSEIFTKVVNHFLTMDKYAVNTNQDAENYGTCVYRDNNDPASSTRCFVGALIPDEEYLVSFEGQSVLLRCWEFDETIKDYNMVHNPIYRYLNETYNFEEIQFLYELQKIHDESINHNPNWKKEVANNLIDFNDEHKLVPANSELIEKLQRI